MTAVRLARGATGRDVIVKFAGLYHGHSDALLAAAGSGVATAGLPGSAGVPAASTADTLVLPYNDVDALEQAFAERGDEIAGVIVESTPANMGVVPPLPGFCTGSTRERISSASMVSVRVGAPKLSPFSAASLTAWTTFGWAWPSRAGPQVHTRST